MKIIFNDGPETIRTDEGDIQRGVAADVSDALGARLLASGHSFTDITKKGRGSAYVPAQNNTKNKKEVGNGTD